MLAPRQVIFAPLQPLRGGRTRESDHNDGPSVLLQRPQRTIVVPREREQPCRCRLFVRSGQAACRYSWRVPPSRSRLRISGCVICSESVIGPGSGRRGAAARSVRWGRCSLQKYSNSRSECRRWRWFQMSVRSRSSCRRSAPSLHDRVHSGHLDPAEHDLDTRVREHIAEQGGELAVPVPDREPRPAPGIFKVRWGALAGVAAADPDRGEAIARSVERKGWRWGALAGVAAAVVVADLKRG